MNKLNNYSSFWLNNDWDTQSSIFDDEPVKKGVDLIALASYRRAISNFVSIVTGDSTIPVTFAKNGDSYTDGKSVVISSKLDDKLFDSTVGLALHEGSHIKLSDFDFLRDLGNYIPNKYNDGIETLRWTWADVKMKHQELLNYVEDRRIDYYIFSNSPGYKGYYHSMYDKYFHSKVIDKALLTDEYTSLDWDSYIFRIINLTNSNSDLDVLPGLREIKNLIFGSVKDLPSTTASFEVASKVFEIIIKNIEPDAQPMTSQSQSPSMSGEGSGGDSGTETDGDASGDGVQISTDGDSSSKSKSSENKPELTDAQKKQLSNAIKKQKNFMKGDISKKKLTKKDFQTLKSVESSGMSYVDVAGPNDRWTGKPTPTKVILIKKFTKELMDDNKFGLIDSFDFYKDRRQSDIDKGIIMGTKLGRKLQVRGESRETKWSRKDSGRIDKRLISELGFGNERVFQTSFVESYSDAFLHISVDASGSMGGDKWRNTQIAVVAIAKACSMIQNVDVVISYRSTHHTSRRRGSSFPLMLIAYDSRVDKFSKIKNDFWRIQPSGTTPEGLCFEAVYKEIEPSTKDKDSYFLNFSDGMPMFSNDSVEYFNNNAIKHTRKMVDMIRGRGVKVLSYFIGDSWERDKADSTFTRMYGKDSQFIDVTSVLPVAKSMNKKFLEK
tara:strand:- start:997 stop:2991 length:1995 start_codon:yes stop_codon:yes gene_type:complete